MSLVVIDWLICAPLPLTNEILIKKGRQVSGELPLLYQKVTLVKVTFIKYWNLKSNFQELYGVVLELFRSAPHCTVRTLILIEPNRSTKGETLAF